MTKKKYRGRSINGMMRTMLNASFKRSLRRSSRLEALTMPMSGSSKGEDFVPSGFPGHVVEPGASPCAAFGLWNETARPITETTTSKTPRPAY